MAKCVDFSQKFISDHISSVSSVEFFNSTDEKFSSDYTSSKLILSAIFMSKADIQINILLRVYIS